MIRLLPAATLILATLTTAACAYEQPYQPGWGGPRPAQVWYQRPAPPPQRWGWQPPPPRWGWQAPPPARWAGPPPSRGWAGPPPRGDRGWDGPRPSRYEYRRHEDRRDDRRW